MNKKHVIVVGGGMVGAACAIKLAQQGAQVSVIENQPIDAQAVLNAEQVDIRVSAINRFSIALLASLGAMAHIKNTRFAPYCELETFENPAQNLLFSADEIEQDYLGYLVENKLIQASLWQGFSHYNIEVLTPNEPLQGIEQTAEHATLKYASQDYRADLIIGADGAQSQVRKHAGIGVTGWQYQQHCMGILIKLNAPQQVRTWQQFTPTGPMAFLPMHAPYANLIWYHNRDYLNKLKALSASELKAHILSHFPPLAGNFEVVQTAVFPLTRQHAQQYYQQRVVLIGDAAHTINPLAGQGVNLGFQDVAALASVLSTQSDYGSLDGLTRYSQQRRTANLAMMSAMDACYFGFSNSLAPLAWARSQFLTLANKATPVKKQLLKYAVGELNFLR